MPKWLQRFSPHSAVTSIHDLDLEMFAKHGKTVLLVDVDNTLVEWRSHDITPELEELVARAKALGFRICAVSNTSKPKRLAALCERLGIEWVRARNKPSRAMFWLALEKFGAEPQEAIMVGDQLMTDVLGANRSGIDAIWVTPMSSKEFFGTKFNRIVERGIGMFLYRYFQPSVAYGV